MKKLKTTNIVLGWLILLSYFFPFFTVKFFETEAISIVKILFKSGYSNCINSSPVFLLIPAIATIISMFVDTVKYPYVLFLAGLSVVFGIAPITAGDFFRAGEPSIGLYIMAVAGGLMCLSGAIQACIDYKKNWIFLLCIVGVAVIPPLINPIALILTMCMVFTLLPLMGIVILFSFLRNRKKKEVN